MPSQYCPRLQIWLNELQQPPLQSIDHPLLAEYRVDLKVLRTDRVHPVISGNKSYKLKFNLKAALDHRSEGVISFGGAWSNHLHALAYSCYLLELPCVAVIRGEPELAGKSAMLKDIHRWGCRLYFVSRQAYRQKDQPEWLAELMAQFPGYFIVPEGGSSALATAGIADLTAQLETACMEKNWYPDQVWCAVGTGATLAGLITARTLNYQLTGVAVMKGAEFLNAAIRQMLSSSGGVDLNWSLKTDYHYGGYGKVSDHLLSEINQFTSQVSCRDPGLALRFDPVYNGKALAALLDTVRQGLLSDRRIVLLHTGGLQGSRGYSASNLT